jgi:glycosyltransferase involved in cell wall biosynthesis
MFGSRLDDRSDMSDICATIVGRVYVGTVLPAHVARLSGEIEVLERVGIEHRQVILGFRDMPSFPERWTEFTEARRASSGAQMIRILTRWLKDHNPEVLHLHCLWAGLIGGIAARLVGNRPAIVYEIHGAVAFETRSRHGGIRSWLRFGVLYLLECVAILLADRLLLVSDEYRKYYPVARWRSGTVIRRVVQKCSEDQDNSLSAEFLALKAYADEERKTGRRILVYSGGVSAWQMVDPTIELMAACVKAGLASIVLLTSDQAAVIQMIRKYLSDDTHVYVTTLRQDEVVRGLSLCDVGFLLRRDIVVNRVASPTKFFEYVYAGLHVVTMPGAATVVPLIELHEVGLVLRDEHASRDLLGWLAKLSITEAEKSRIRRLALAKYSWNACTETLLTLYSN